METVLSEIFLRLVSIMDELREKCPWDKKQTIHTLRQLTIEETYELVDAISEEDWKGMKEELGDILLHIVFYAKIAAEKGKFTLEEVIGSVCEKLIARHPHIYDIENIEGIVKVNNEDDVKQNWEKLKLKEGKKSILSGVPKTLPSMVKAMRLQEKAKQVGFEWETKEQVWDKVQEEKLELQEAVAGGDADKMEDELGDLFFSIVNYARFLNLDAENALERTNKKFINRFTKMESMAAERGKQLHELDLGQMDTLWNEVKKSNEVKK
jgi:MazG family protein